MLINLWRNLLRTTLVVLILSGTNTLVADNNNGKNIPKNKSLVPALTEGGYRYLGLMEQIADGSSATDIADASRALSKQKFYESILAIATKTLNEFQMVSTVNGEKNPFSESEFNAVESLITDTLRMAKSQSKVNMDEKLKKGDLETKLDSLEAQQKELLELLDVTLIKLMEQHNSETYYNRFLAMIYGTKKMVERWGAPLPYVNADLRNKISTDTIALFPYVTPEVVEETREKLSSMFYKDQNLDQARNRIATIRNFLEKNVIEQPEAIEALLSIEEEKYQFPKREAPEVLVLMGLPGTGKDTIAESYVKALHPGNKRADLDHLYRFQVLRTRADQWSELGSATGYKGSGEFPKLFDFVVDHSGGRYKKVEIPAMGGEVKYKIEENPNWRGRTLPGTKGPEDAVMFLNEFHDWAFISKNEFAKEFLEKGIITVNNPNGGVKKLYFPTNIIVASNDGIDLIADRHLDGRPRGRSQSYKDLFANWKAVYKNRRLLKSTFMKTALGQNVGEDRKGTSEEVTSRLPNMVLLRPLSPEGLKRIASIHLNSLKKKLSTLNEKIGKVKLSWGESVEVFVQEYLYDAEESARPIKEKVKSLIEGTLKKAIFRGDIVTDGKEVDLKLDIKTNENGTSNLNMEVKFDGGTQKYSDLMTRTSEVEHAKPLSPEELKELYELENRINKSAFGVEHISAKLTKAIVNARVRSNENELVSRSEDIKAQVFGFFGLSSTGKTELTKVLAKELNGKKESLWIIDANQLQSQAKWNEAFGFDFSTPDERSEFQKEYDKRQGKMIVVIDELANVRDKSLLKMLYPYFDEPIVGERNMKNVTFIVTGNAGEEWYQGIPKDIPEVLRHFSMLEVFKKAISDIGAQEELLLRYFPEALLKRMGMSRVFFFSPLDFKNIRKLFKLKVNQLFEKIYSPKKQTHWWNVYFKNTKEAEKILTVMEREGFGLDGQGRSIDRFVNESFAEELNEYLLKNGIPIGEKVELSLHQTFVDKFAFDSMDDYGEHKKGLYLKVKTEGKTGTVFIQGKGHDHFPEHSDLAKIFTAYHEAGHEVVRGVFLGDKQKSRGISIIPGVTEIGSSWIFYAGIAKSENVARMRFTEEALLRSMAVLFGGEVAESLTSKYSRHGEGKSNDIERATEMARAAILEWGLSEKFGRHAKSPGQSYSEYMSTLSEEKKVLYEQELDRYLKEARKLAVEALLANWTTFVDMGKSLAVIGDMSGDEVREVYKRNKKVFAAEHDSSMRSEYLERVQKLRTKKYHRFPNGEVSFQGLSKELPIWVRVKSARSEISRDAEILHEELMPESLKKIEDILELRISEARASVDISDMRIGKRAANRTCKMAFK